MLHRTYPTAVCGNGKDTGTDRPDTGRNDTGLHQQGGKGTKESRESDADADNRTSLDTEGSGRHDRPATEIQRLP